MYEVLTGKQRSLVFPIMCNAFVKMTIQIIYQIQVMQQHLMM